MSAEVAKMITTTTMTGDDASVKSDLPAVPSKVDHPKSPSPASPDDESEKLSNSAPQHPDVEEEENKKEERSAVFETRLEAAAVHRERGNELFKSHDFSGALNAYETGLYQCDFDEMQYNFELMDQHRAAVDAVRVPLLLNAAACELRLEHWDAAAKMCSNALKFEPKSAKALFRRGQALRRAGKFDKAKIDLTAAAKLEPSDRAVRIALSDVVKALREEKTQTRSLWEGKLAVAAAAEEEQIENKEADCLNPAPLTLANGGSFCDQVKSAVWWLMGWAETPKRKTS